MVKRVPIDLYCEKKVSTLPKNYSGLIDYIDISSVDNTEKRIISYQTIEAGDAPSRAKQLLQKGDIIVSTVRPNLNAVAVVENETDNLAVGSTGYCVLRCKDNMDVRYLFNFCRSQYFVDDMTSQATGASYPAVSTSIVRSSLIPCYPVEEQREIAKRIDAVNNLIVLRRRQLSKLDELVKARFVEMFGDPYINDKNWIVDTLGNYMTTLTDFSANGSYELLDSNVVMYDEPNYAVMVRTTDLESGNLSSNVKYIDKSAYELLNKSKLFGGELIMNKIGSAGKIYIMPYIDQPASLGRNAFMFRFNDRLNMKYLYFLLSSDYGTNEIQQYVRGAVTKTITKDSTRVIRIIVPPIELQNQFAAFVEQTDKSKSAIQKSLDKLETLKKALMQKYFG